MTVLEKFRPAGLAFCLSWRSWHVHIFCAPHLVSSPFRPTARSLRVSINRFRCQSNRAFLLSLRQTSSVHWSETQGAFCSKRRFIMKLFRSTKSRRIHRKRSDRLEHAVACVVEPLERRTMLAGTWTALNNTLPSGDSASTMLLLSDGTVMVQGGGSFSSSNQWYNLTPDSSGSYVNGTFATLNPMNLGRLYYAS